MATKIAKGAFPSGHGPNDFKCFGPPATKDSEFEGTCICDMGCFKQDGTDSNKYYHAAVIQSRINNEWYTYFEWGRTGATHPQFQFSQCSGKADAEGAYCKQLHSKNDKRGEWHTHSTLGRILRAKKSKDCYLVRSQATRATGLPDARTITANEGGKKVPAKKSKSKTSKPAADRETLSLMSDLNVATVQYTRGAMTDDSIPTQLAIDEARDILISARQRVVTVGHNVNHQIKDKELKELTSLMYGRIPKKKNRGAAPETWILSENNIDDWKLDLDAFESALYATDLGDVEHDPFGGMKIDMHWIAPNSDLGKFIHSWWPDATKNVHGHIGRMTVANAWFVSRHGDEAKLNRAQTRINKDKIRSREYPLHQPRERPDLDSESAKIFARSRTALLFHGTRSVNVSGILREALRLPKTLVGVATTGAMFGPGTYFADDWKKSAGYCSTAGAVFARGRGGVSRRGAFMFACDVALGQMHLAADAYGYTSAPKGSHSVFGKGGYCDAWGGKLRNNEFITFNSDQNRLRFLVEFRER
ncbi:MAG: WGR domain-containing protein [Nitrospirae bacterium]|nr:WGR domain-containing protein [Nitrospirota bacterium]